MTEQRPFRREKGFPARGGHGLARIAVFGAIFGALLAPVLIPFEARAYRFFDGTGDESPHVSWRLVTANDAQRWSSEIWGPGGTLHWEVAADPDWAVLYGDAQGAALELQRALDAWTDVPSADISWDLHVGASWDESDEDAAGGGGKDGRNSIFIDSSAGGGLLGYALVWDAGLTSEGTWEIVECDWALGSFATEIPDWVTPDYRDDYLSDVREIALTTSIHELGHCIGLAHAGAFAMSGRVRMGVDPQVGADVFEYIHPGDPVMSYGVEQDPGKLTADDVVGASLLRPAAGWRDRTGNISGALRVAGAPAPWVQIWAIPLEGDPQKDRVGTFSDHEGRFLIEGLPPGDYLLWAHPLVILGAHPIMILNGPPLDLDDTLAANAVRAVAGATADWLEVRMRVGRTSRPTPDAIRTRPAPGWSITDRWGSPCSGLRVRAERPYPADGPRATAEPERNLGGDIWLTTTLVSEWSSGSESVVFDWAGIYRNWIFPVWRERVIHVNGPREGAPWMDLSIADWRIEREGAVVRHSMEIAWPESAVAGWRLRSVSGTCPNEPMIVCGPTGCGITR